MGFAHPCSTESLAKRALRTAARSTALYGVLIVVGHGSSETIRAGDIPYAPFVPASELQACGDAAAGGWLAAMRAMMRSNGVGFG